MPDEVKRYTSIAEMARECAEHQGSMIVDIEVKPDGETHIHAVATWEPQELPTRIEAEMTDEELLAEWQMWNTKILTTPRWGAGLGIAYEFRMDYECEMRRRGLSIPRGEKLSAC